MAQYTIYLHVSDQDQLDASVSLQARGYKVKTLVDAHQLLKEHGLGMSARNVRWAVTHLLLMCNFSVLHGDIEPADAVAAIDHVRRMGGYVIHMDNLSFTSSMMTQEVLDGHDLAGDALNQPARVREAVRNGWRELGLHLLNGASAWLKRADAKLHASGVLKNPMVREQQQRRSTYSEPDKLSTTG